MQEYNELFPDFQAAVIFVEFVSSTCWCCCEYWTASEKKRMFWWKRRKEGRFLKNKQNEKYFVLSDLSDKMEGRAHKLTSVLKSNCLRVTHPDFNLYHYKIPHLAVTVIYLHKALLLVFKQSEGQPSLLNDRAVSALSSQLYKEQQHRSDLSGSFTTFKRHDRRSINGKWI